jgi:hypothetical protein
MAGKRIGAKVGNLSSRPLEDVSGYPRQYSEVNLGAQSAPVRTIQVQNLGPMPKGGHQITDREGLLNAIGSQTLFQNRGGYVPLPIRLSPEKQQEIIQYVEPVMHGFTPEINERYGKQSFVFRRTPQEFGLRTPQEKRDLAVYASSGISPRERIEGVFPRKLEFGEGIDDIVPDSHIPDGELIPANVRVVPQWQRDQRLVSPPRIQRENGAPAIEMEYGRRPMWISNDDWSEAGLHQGKSPKDYNFGWTQGETVGNNSGKMYDIAGDWPRQHPVTGEYYPVSTRSILNDINALSGPDMQESKSLSGGFVTSGSTEMARPVYQINQPGRPKTWVDSPTVEYDRLGYTNATNVPVDAPDAMFGTWRDSAYSQAEQMQRQDILDGVFGQTDLRKLEGIGYRGAPTEALSSAPQRQMLLAQSIPVTKTVPLYGDSVSEQVNTAYLPELTGIGQPQNYRFGRMVSVDNPQDYATVQRTRTNLAVMPTEVGQAYKMRGNMLLPGSMNEVMPSGEVRFGNNFVRHYSEDENLQPNAYGMLIPSGKVPTAFSNAVEPKGGYNLSSSPAYVNKAANQIFYGRDINKPENYSADIINLPSSAYGDIGLSTFRTYISPEEIASGAIKPKVRMYNEYGAYEGTDERRAIEKRRILEKASRLTDLEQQYGNTVNPFEMLPRSENWNESIDAHDQLSRLQRTQRQENAAFRNKLEGRAEDIGQYQNEIHRQLILKEMARRNPEAAVVANAMADRTPQDFGSPEVQSVMSQGLSGVPTTDYDRHLLNSFQRQQEMERRAQLGEFIMRTTQEETMPLPDVEPVTRTVMGIDREGYAKFRTTTKPMDYRDVLAQARGFQERGYGQLQQAIPVQYDENGSRFPVMQVGPANMNAYRRSKSDSDNLYNYVDDSNAGVAYTKPNQFSHQATPALSSRVFHGQQSFPVTMDVMPSRADNFTPEEAIRVMPAYQYTQDDLRNSAGNRLRGEGYAPSGALADQEIQRRAQALLRQNGLG